MYIDYDLRHCLPEKVRGIIRKKIDELVYTVARYNVPLRISDYLSALFFLYNSKPFRSTIRKNCEDTDFFDGFLNEMIWYVDNKRQKGPLGDNWFYDVRRLVFDYESFLDAIRIEPYIKESLRLDDICDMPKKTGISDAFCQEVIDAYFRNASEYDIEKAYDERCIPLRNLKAQVESRGEKYHSNGEYFSPLLVYDGKTFTIREDKTYLSKKGVFPIRKIGSPNDYFECLIQYLNIPTDEFYSILSELGLNEEEPMSPDIFLSLESRICEFLGLDSNHSILKIIRLDFAKNWLNHIINNESEFKIPRKKEISSGAAKELEILLELEYYLNVAIPKMRLNMMDFLEVAYPILNSLELRTQNSRRDIALVMINYFNNKLDSKLDNDSIELLAKNMTRYKTFDEFSRIVHDYQ